MDFTSISSDPELFIAQLKYSPELKGITSQKEKFVHVVALLEIAKPVRDIILNLPSTNPFQELKREIFNRTACRTKKKPILVMVRVWRN